MNNSIVNTIHEKDYIKDGYKQIYPNNNGIKIEFVRWQTDYNRLSKGCNCNRLNLYESFRERNNLFLVLEDDYRMDYISNLNLIKGSQEQSYKIERVYVVNGSESPVSLAEKSTNIYTIISKKINKIYFDRLRNQLLIITDDKFVSKKEAKYLAEKAREKANQKSISDLFE